MSGHKNNNFPTIFGGDFHTNDGPSDPSCAPPPPVCEPDPTCDSNSNSNTNTNTNELDNSICNTVHNNVDTTVNVDVNVCANLDEGLSSPVIDLSNLNMADSFGSLIMPDVVNQTLTDHGVAFNIDQVNNLVDNDTVSGATVTYSAGGSDSGGSGQEWWNDHGGQTTPAGFSMEAKLHSGDSSIEGASSGATSSANATLNQDAFTQTITQGANIQFNSQSIQAAGDHIQDDHSLGHG